jgi:cytochrome c biogenesis protein CcmG/thiol:disulfide interchange protein DsbE
MEKQTWAGAAREVWRTATRHKIIAVLVALCVAGSLAAIGVAGSASHGPARAADPPAPAFSVATLGHSGQHVALSEYAGQPLIVNFFASWCVPCKQETPLLARFYRSEAGKVALVGLDVNDPPANALAFTHAEGVSYPVGSDPQLIAASAYSVAALPQTFFLNAQHRIVDHVFGALTQADIDRGVALATGHT